MDKANKKISASIKTGSSLLGGLFEMPKTSTSALTYSDLTAL